MGCFLRLDSNPDCGAVGRYSWRGDLPDMLWAEGAGCQVGSLPFHRWNEMTNISLQETVTKKTPWAYLLRGVPERALPR